jgi:hypothetical protein
MLSVFDQKAKIVCTGKDEESQNEYSRNLRRRWKMKKYFLAGLLTVMLMFGAIGQVEASSIVQNFSNSWSVKVWDYYGFVAAVEWQYQPYTASTQALTSVHLTMNISVSGITPGDTFKYRSAFATSDGPIKVEYQFYNEEWFYDVLTSDLSINKDYYFTSVNDLARWTNPLYGPIGSYYWEQPGFFTIDAGVTGRGCMGII